MVPPLKNDLCPKDIGRIVELHFDIQCHLHKAHLLLIRRAHYNDAWVRTSCFHPENIDRIKKTLPLKKKKFLRKGGRFGEYYKPFRKHDHNDLILMPPHCKRVVLLGILLKQFEINFRF